MNDLLDSLKSIGLNEKESRVYLALLKFDEADVGDIADEAGVKRPTAYVILDELRKKGLVLKIPHAKKIIFQAKTPDELYDRTISDLNKFEKILPRLRSISPTRKAIKTLYFEGIDGLKDAMYYKLDKLKDSTNEGFFAKIDAGMPQAVVDIFHKWNKDREKNNIKISGLTPDHPSTKEFKERYPDLSHDIKLVPLEDYHSDISIEITKEFVRIVDGHELKAIIIENPRITDALKQILKIAKDKYQI